MSLCGSVICALWSPAGKGLISWLSFVVSNCEFVTFPLVSWVRCGTCCIDSESLHPYVLLHYYDVWLLQVIAPSRAHAVSLTILKKSDRSFNHLKGNVVDKKAGQYSHWLSGQYWYKRDVACRHCSIGWSIESMIISCTLVFNFKLNMYIFIEPNFTRFVQGFNKTSGLIRS